MVKPPQLNVEVWVDDYGDALFQFARARVKDGPTAEDLVQETFLAAFQAKERYKGRSSEKTWLFGILKHKIIDHYRKSKQFVNVHDYSDDPDHVEAFFNAKGSWHLRPSHWTVNPAKAQANREFIDHFFKCLSGMPKRTADVFIKREIDGLETGDICKRYDITEKNCWVILYRARMLLRRCLELVGLSPHSERQAP